MREVLCEPCPDMIMKIRTTTTTTSLPYLISIIFGHIGGTQLLCDQFCLHFFTFCLLIPRKEGLQRPLKPTHPPGDTLKFFLILHHHHLINAPTEPYDFPHQDDILPSHQEYPQILLSILQVNIESFHCLTQDDISKLVIGTQHTIQLPTIPEDHQ